MEERHYSHDVILHEMKESGPSRQADLIRAIEAQYSKYDLPLPCSKSRLRFAMTELKTWGVIEVKDHVWSMVAGWPQPVSKRNLAEAG